MLEEIIKTIIEEEFKTAAGGVGMISFKPILDAISEEAVAGNTDGTSAFYDEVPEDGKEEYHPAPELRPGIEDQHYGESVEL